MNATNSEQFGHIKDLTPQPRNARKHTPRNIGDIVNALQEVGAARSIVIDEAGVVLAGNGTIEAAAEAGITKVQVVEADGDTIVAVRRTGLTDKQKERLALYDNRAAEHAQWDTDILLALKDEGALDGLWTDAEIAALEALQAPAEGLTDPDAVPDARATDIQPGDLFELGGHRLLCGDSTMLHDVERIMDGRTPHLCLTDPPYGLGDSKTTKNNYRTYSDTRDNLIETIGGFLPLARQFCGAVVLTPGNKNHRMYPDPEWTMAWFTPAGVGRGPWGFCCWQPILCYGSDPKLARQRGSHPDAIVHTESAEKNGHPCAKPIGFWAWLMERTSEVGDVIYEPFSGSGTTIVAAEKLHRACLAIELDPSYCQVAIDRWEAFTGRTASKAGEAIRP